MKIAILGAGRVAFHLGKALMSAGHDIIQVYSRTASSASEVALRCGGAPITAISQLTYEADAYLFAVTDMALPHLIPLVCKGREERVFLHTAGSMALDVFQGMAFHYAVLYPMQTFSKERELDFSQIPCFIEANDAKALETVTSMANAVSRRVELLSSDDRKYLHLAAVFACNFSNHCFALAAEILKQHHMSFDVMLPLIDETVKKVHQFSPRTVQTGPAVRYDENVIRQQSQLLRKDPLMKDLYDRLSLSIHKLSIEQ